MIRTTEIKRSPWLSIATVRSSYLDQQISASSFNNSSGVQMIGRPSPALSSTSNPLGMIRAFAMCVQFHVKLICSNMFITPSHGKSGSESVVKLVPASVNVANYDGVKK